MFGPLVAYLPTPRTAAGTVAADTLAVLVDRAVRAGVDAVAVLGSTGGFAYLDAPERRTVVRAAVEAAQGRVPVVAGVGALTTRAVLEHADDATADGATALLVPTMAYLPLTDAEVLGLFADVSAQVALPFWIYHNPRTTGVELSVETLLRIAALPGVAGLKDRGTCARDVRERCRALLAGVDPAVAVGFSGDELGATALLAGARTWHSGLAGVVPSAYVRAAALAVAGDAVGTARVLDDLRPLVTLGAVWGAGRLAHAAGPALGLAVGALPRPLQPVPDDVAAQVCAQVARLEAVVQA